MKVIITPRACARGKVEHYVYALCKACICVTVVDILSYTELEHAQSGSSRQWNLNFYCACAYCVSKLPMINFVGQPLSDTLYTYTRPSNLNSIEVAMKASVLAATFLALCVIPV